MSRIDEIIEELHRLTGYDEVTLISQKGGSYVVFSCCGGNDMLYDMLDMVEAKYHVAYAYKRAED